MHRSSLINMNLLILSEEIKLKQSSEDTKYTPYSDVKIEVVDINSTRFIASVFDYDVTIVHVTKPRINTDGYYTHLPKLIDDSIIAVQNGRSIICLPSSEDFFPELGSQRRNPIYDWLQPLGIDLQENYGKTIRSTGAGRAEVFKEYLKYSPTYHQIIKSPQIEPKNRIAVVGETQIVVGAELDVNNGTVVILPPPLLGTDFYQLSMSNLVGVAQRYYDRARRNIPVGDSPDWLDKYLVFRDKELDTEISRLSEEKKQFDSISYTLYGTGDELQDSVKLLLEKFDLKVEPQPKGSNIDLKAKHASSGLGFAIEVTGTKGVVGKDSNKVSQAFEYFREGVGTPEENDNLIILANTQYHLDPAERRAESFTENFVKLFRDRNVLLMTTVQLYELWKAIYEGNRKKEDIVKELHSKQGLYES